ncbi:uncharacterized protein BBA_03891 [Beauveria bassiana ARSEF 2860]|uniref:DUF7770 domain-containing protein n=1 Tax=Beauveria bassiana (strain ARSEF 2860) TaxID=655819 RepID=J4UPX6_BEAB2|nr:uncharacterized protein BBA_03891 [Beauveria bassiana ARSEF 2860]EJP67317.1 hypothetical protein BBA_03891 [Beauveria bassiana ARSEF 2860]
MSIEYELIKDDVTANNIAANAPFLQKEVIKSHADGFTLGPSMDEDKPNTSKIHWAIILDTPRENIRLSMESRLNERTGKHGVLVLKVLAYFGISRNVFHRQTFSRKGSTVKVQDILDLVFAQGWHKYKMLTTSNGAKKGCRHHTQTMLAGFQSRNWIESRSDTSKSVEEFLPFVYTRYTDDSRKLSIEKRPIDIGSFL